MTAIIAGAEATSDEKPARRGGHRGRRHWELFDGTRRGDGSYAGTPLTASSTVDNIRPVIATNASGAWARLNLNF